LEIILIDDGSPDKCGEICEEFAKIDNRIIVIHKKNGGLSSARNAGLDIATGDYIGFVDSDDWIDARMYEVLLESILKTKSDIVECKFIETKGANIEIPIKDTWRSYTFDNLTAIQNHLNGKYFYRSVWQKLYKKNLFNNLRFPDGKIPEDLYVTYKLLYSTKKVTFVDFTGYYYFQREDSIMGKKESRLIIGSMEALREQHDFISKNIPELKSTSGQMYFNCLLKAYLFFSKEKVENPTKPYLNMISDELNNRKDIKLNGLTKYAFLTFKISPYIFINLMSLIGKEG
jgi:Glycosyltransferases involved in cell wall biogenesis